ncbi:MAG TPA: energy transducer TonB [Pyrinomonadaceae bacterium]|nr:energy transducer TonB [Pyrinomonadaceae bacterium]
MKKSPVLITRVALSGFLLAFAVIPAVSSKSSFQETSTDKPQSTKAKVKSKPDPRCPKEAKEQGIHATIVLRAIFRSTAEVTDIKFAAVRPSDLPERIVHQLSDESIRVAEKIKFEPATKEGHPVSIFMQLEYNFNCY